jgi:hypothetical protein
MWLRRLGCNGFVSSVNRAFAEWFNPRVKRDENFPTTEQNRKNRKAPLKLFESDFCKAPRPPLDFFPA